jgi:RecA/RadA recombinase
LAWISGEVKIDLLFGALIILYYYFRIIMRQIVSHYLRRIAESLGKIDVLYVVHPDSVLEQTYKIDYVKSFIDKIQAAIDSFKGIVLVTQLDSSAAHQTKEEAYTYVKRFMDEIKSNSKVTVIEENRRKMDTPLGTGAMSKVIDDMFLKGTIGKIILVGAFTCDKGYKMCVDDTYASLVHEYGPEHIVKDPNLILKSGPIF